MIFYFKNLKLYKLKAKSYKLNRGMTYVELIVVLSIFSIMTSVVLFNYSKFEDKVNIKVLANDIALKIVEAQKSSLSGELLPAGKLPTINPWKPAYGIYFNLSNNKNFVYFVDLNNNNSFDDSICTGECLNSITITKGDFVSRIDSYLASTPTQITNPLAITFKRPDSRAIFKSNGLLLTGFDYIQITITSPSAKTAYIKIYPSGRIQKN